MEVCWTLSTEEEIDKSGLEGIIKGKLNLQGISLRIDFLEDKKVYFKELVTLFPFGLFSLEQESVCRGDFKESVDGKTGQELLVMKVNCEYPFFDGILKLSEKKILAVDLEGLGHSEDSETVVYTSKLGFPKNDDLTSEVKKLTLRLEKLECAGEEGCKYRDVAFY